MAVWLYQSESLYVAELPHPAHDQDIEPVANETIARSAGGTAIVDKHGPTRYRVTRTFEGLTDAQVKQVIDFWNALPGAAQELLYQFDVHGAGTREVACRIVEPPQIEKVCKNNWDVTLVFEQTARPTRVSGNATSLAAPSDLTATAEAD